MEIVGRRGQSVRDDGVVAQAILDDAVGAGKIRYPGLSNFTGRQVQKRADAARPAGLASPWIDFDIPKQSGSDRQAQPPTSTWTMGCQV
ncbi:hypothetical protein ABT026_07485 [Streptomyces sp. NPDC002734]|uniref:hypothetical protein n=1 Tax=Streptomyces sp. NPDC002734 TaxID=3154426 RepID=UPI0033325B4A